MYFFKSAVEFFILFILLLNAGLNSGMYAYITASFLFKIHTNQKLQLRYFIFLLRLLTSA
ncbi:hypothetical protein CBG46_02855 [Actinobacillus succinogenes]|nr:hypothetical protein CBG46_02855 [Actinobacillus succinogenes]